MQFFVDLLVKNHLKFGHCDYLRFCEDEWGRVQPIVEFPLFFNLGFLVVRLSIFPAYICAILKIMGTMPFGTFWSKTIFSTSEYSLTHLS